MAAASIQPTTSLYNAFQMIHSAYCFYSLYRLWESSMSHLLALHQLRHGTSIVNYVRIQFSGLHPDNAYDSSGEAAYLEVTDPERNKGERERLVYVMKDESSTPCQCKKEPFFCSNFFLSKRTAPLEYAYQAGAAMFAVKRVSPSLRDTLMKVGGVMGWFTPILKFHFDPNELQQFENDPWLSCIAFRSSQSISANHLGILGTFRMGLNRRLAHRIQQNPQKFLFGLVQMVAATVITLELSKGVVSQSRLIAQSPWKASILWATMHVAFFTAT